MSEVRQGCVRFVEVDNSDFDDMGDKNVYRTLFPNDHDPLLEPKYQTQYSGTVESNEFDQTIPFAFIAQALREQFEEQLNELRKQHHEVLSKRTEPYTAHVGLAVRLFVAKK